VATVPVPVHLLAVTPSVRAARPQTEEGAASVGARGGGLVAHYARTLGWRPEWTEGFPRDLFGARLPALFTDSAPRRPATASEGAKNHRRNGMACRFPLICLRVYLRPLPTASFAHRKIPDQWMWILSQARRVTAAIKKNSKQPTNGATHKRTDLPATRDAQQTDSMNDPNW
jgi:hypothetical protein